MKKNNGFVNRIVLAGSCILIAASIFTASARGHWGGRGYGHWGGYHNYCGWGIGWSSPYYYGNYYGGYPYGNYVVVESPEIRTTTIVTKLHDTVASPKVETPAVSTQPQASQSLENAPKDTSASVANAVVGDTVTIYVPNSAGRFTPVKLVKHGSGYTGPQGEFYPHNPTVAQLRVLYAY